MKEIRRRCTVLAAGIGFLILIFDSRLALEGARSGVELCIRTVIPALFPFFVLSLVLTGSWKAGNTPVSRAIAGLLGIPDAALPVLIPAFLGGYPVGAKSVGDLYRNRLITRQQAQRLLSFCSNAGPAFLFGMVSGFFPEKKMVLLLWITHMGSALLTALSIPPVPHDSSGDRNRFAGSQVAVIPSAARAMGSVCCWVILLRTMITFLERWFLWILPPWAQVLLTGMLELTNGCCQLLLIQDVRIRFVICECMLSLGGLCVLLQTATVTEGLSLGSYLKGKGLQTLYSALISCGLVYQFGVIGAALLPVLIFLLRQVQKRSGNPRTFPV